jgi:hypothetical protein
VVIRLASSGTRDWRPGLRLSLHPGGRRAVGSAAGPLRVPASDLLTRALELGNLSPGDGNYSAGVPTRSVQSNVLAAGCESVAAQQGGGRLVVDTARAGALANGRSVGAYLTGGRSPMVDRHFLDRYWPKWRPWHCWRRRSRWPRGPPVGRSRSWPRPRGKGVVTAKRKLPK